jgi:hypothetical protein
MVRVGVRKRRQQRIAAGNIAADDILISGSYPDMRLELPVDSGSAILEPRGTPSPLEHRKGCKAAGEAFGRDWQAPRPRVDGPANGFDFGRACRQQGGVSGEPRGKARKGHEQP